MVRKKISASSATPSPASAVSDAGINNPIVPPLCLLAVSLVVIFFSLPNAGKAVQSNPSGLAARNFGFLLKTSSWLPRVLTVTSDNFSEDLSSQLDLWLGHKNFLYDASANSAEIGLGPRIIASLGAQNPWQAFQSGDLVLGFDLQENEIYRHLYQTIAPKLSRPSQNAKLTIVDGRAVEFQSDLEGRELDNTDAVTEIAKALFRRQSTIILPVVTVKPEITLAETNDLGINELVTEGQSDFHGSTASRVQNIRVGSAKFNGVILKPGEEFSFNRYLGPVTAEAGFKPELVIKSTGTVPELGGGLCQVSTTSFRAALYGGLPITARKNHSYAVKYYAPQGTDATIYPGAADFKFINDTSGYLLIWTKMEGTILYFDYYGTKDARTVAIDGPYQYDKGPGGAMKARLTRTVTLNGEGKSDTFLSKYVSQDLFPRVYEFPPAVTPPPIETPITPVAQ